MYDEFKKHLENCGFEIVERGSDVELEYDDICRCPYCGAVQNAPEKHQMPLEIWNCRDCGKGFVVKILIGETVKYKILVDEEA